MPAKPKIEKGKKKPGIKQGPKNPKRKMVTVFLPAIIPGKENPYEEEKMCEEEISYQDAMLAVKMEKLAAKGLTNDQIIDALPLSRHTFYQRLKTDNYFSYCLNKHRGKAVSDVELALFNNAVGFEYKEEQATPSGKVVEVFKQKLPDTKAQEFFLTNRRPEEWKKKVEQVHSVGEGMTGITFSIKRYEE